MKGKTTIPHNERQLDNLLVEYNTLIRERDEELNRAHRYLQMCITIITIFIGGILALFQEPNLMVETRSIVFLNLIMHIIPMIILLFCILYLGPISASQQIIDYLIIIEPKLGLQFYTQQRKNLTKFQVYGSTFIVGCISLITGFFMLLISSTTNEIISYFIMSKIFLQLPFSSVLVLIISLGYLLFGVLLIIIIGFGLAGTYRPRAR